MYVWSLDVGYLLVRVKGGKEKGEVKRGKGLVNELRDWGRDVQEGKEDGSDVTLPLT